MDEDLISKKELLEHYKISYGALYRWKRMGLIPEGWFLRRSAPTGQETFFRRAQICPRIELILQNKERVSLDELAASLKEQHETAAAARTLVIETAHWKKELSIEELTRLTLTQDGKTIDILEKIKEIQL